jgi:type I restriction enzyme S subunit
MSGRPRLGDFFSNRQEPGRPGLPVMSVTMNDSLVLRDDLDRRTESALRPDQHLLVRKGDIAYNMMRMWQGACGLATADGVVSPAYVVLAPKSGIDSGFAYHWFKSDRMIHYFWAYSHGLTEDRLRLYFDEFAEIPVAPPPLAQQRRISAVLDQWDQAIGNLERLIIVRRKQQAVILKRLFEQPNPTKLDGTAWRLVKIGEAAECYSGGTPDRGDKTLYGGGIPWVKSGEITSSKILSTEETLAESGVSASSAKWVPAGSTLIAMYGANAGQVGRLGIDATTNQAVLAIVPNTDIVDPEYIYHAVLSVIPSLMRKLQGSGQPNLSAGIVKDEKIFVCEKTKQAKIAQAATEINAVLNGSADLLETFRSQKCSLMQKLLTGEWRLDERFDPAGLAPRSAFVGGAA